MCYGSLRIPWMSPGVPLTAMVGVMELCVYEKNKDVRISSEMIYMHLLLMKRDYLYFVDVQKTLHTSNSTS